MRTKEEVALVHGLVAEGLNDCEISAPNRDSPADSPRLAARTDPSDNVSVQANTSCNQCGHEATSSSGLPIPEYTYLLGMYLGDGCISRAPKGVLAPAHFPRHEVRWHLIDECVRSMGGVMPDKPVNVRRTRPGVNCASSQFSFEGVAMPVPSTRPGNEAQAQHRAQPVAAGPHRQDPRPLIAGLIHSDGCRVINPSMGHTLPALHVSNNESADIRRIFCDACDQLGIPWRQPKKRNDLHRSPRGRRDARQLHRTEVVVAPRA